MPLLAIINETKCTIIAPQNLFNHEITKNTNELMMDFKSKYVEPTVVAGKKLLAKWVFPESDSEEYLKSDVRLTLEFDHIMK